MSKPTPWLMCIILAGCATNKTPEDPQAAFSKTEPTETSKIVSLSGPGGTVSLGGSVDEAKAAFPPPEEAEVYDKSMAFSVVTSDGWAWGAGSGTGFEAAVKNGKIVALAETRLDGPADDRAIEDQIGALGKPTSRYDGKSGSMLIWVSGESARFFVVLTGDNPIFGSGTLTMVGDKEEMKLLNYRYDDPKTFILQLDATIEQMDKAKQ